MYVAPQSDIYLLRGVPLEPSYDHTLYFASESAQRQYFTNTAGIKRFTQQTYQRVNNGILRIVQNANNLNNYNYLMFRNQRDDTVPAGKWFYAFITSVEYINENLTQITYEIDHLQTWFFEMVREQCFVEREHSETDEAGDNIVPEPVRLGDYFYSPPIHTSWTDNGGVTHVNIFADYGCVLVCPYKRYPTLVGYGSWRNRDDSESAPLPPYYIDNQINSLFYTVLKDTNSVATALYELETQGKVSSIVCIYLVPLTFLWAYENYDTLTGDSTIIQTTYYNVGARPETLGNYTPVNKKLLTAPYNKFIIDSGCGAVQEYAYEFFTNRYSSIAFDVHANLLQSVSFKAVPKLYKGRQTCYEEAAMMCDFPFVAYTVDTFKAWIAQTKTRVAYQLVNAAVGANSGFEKVIAGRQMLTPKTQVLSKRGANYMAEGYSEMGESIVGTIGGIVAEGIERNINPMQAQGSQDGSLEIAMGMKDFVGYQMYINPNDARIIDDFFTMFGYATKRVKVPNIAARPHWTYTKTVGCKIGGNIPSEANEAICTIFNRGITFWRNPSEVGDYTLDNSPE